MTLQQDAKVVENACLALARIAQSLSHSPPHLELLCNCGLIANALQLIAVSESGSMTSQLSVSTYYGLIKLLTTCTTGCHTVAENLLQAGVSGTLRSLLARFPPRCSPMDWIAGLGLSGITERDVRLGLMPDCPAQLTAVLSGHHLACLGAALV